MSMLLMLSIFISCDANDGKAPDLSENPEAREDVYEQILNDKQLFSEFIDEMGKNEMAMENFSNNQLMSNRMYSGNRMHRMMRNNPQMRDSMLQGMMSNMEMDSTHRPTPLMRQRMIQHMQWMMQQDTAFAREMQEMMRNQTAKKAK